MACAEAVQAQKQICPVCVADLVLLHNHVMHALSQITARTAVPILWDNCPGNVKDSFKTNFKFYANCIGTLQPEYRNLPMNEADQQAFLF